MLLADVPRVLDRLVDDIVHVLYGGRDEHCQTVMKILGRVGAADIRRPGHLRHVCI
jgi:hypothetical protein